MEFTKFLMTTVGEKPPKKITEAIFYFPTPTNIKAISVLSSKDDNVLPEAPLVV